MGKRLCGEAGFSSVTEGRGVAEEVALFEGA